MRWLGASNKVVRTVKAFVQALSAPSTAPAAEGACTLMSAHLTAGAGRALSHWGCSASTSLSPSLAAPSPHPLSGKHPMAHALLVRQPPGTTCCAAPSPGSPSGAGAGAGQPRGRGRPSSSHGTSRGTSSSASPDDLRSIKGVGPANEELLRRSKILRVQDLQALLLSLKDMDQLAEYLQSEVGIHRLHGKLIAQEVGELVKAEAAAAREGERQMVTLAVEGNISAGKSTFLDVLSHQDTNLRDVLQVVPEPVHQWQAFNCVDRLGRQKEENVLQKFYSDPHRFAYSFQHYVLVSRMAEDRSSRRCGKELRVVERSIFSDRQVFVRAMHSAGTMEDFEVSVYNTIFDNEVHGDTMLVPDGFVYLRAEPRTCMERMQRRNRGEEGGVSRDYLELLHANHEDWLREGMSMTALQRLLDRAHGGYGGGGLGASVLAPASEAAVQHFVQTCTPGVSLDRWKLELIENVPEAIKDQVLLLKGTEGLPQLQHRLALVMDHDQDIDIHRDSSARQEYADKIQTFYAFVKQWKERERVEEAALKTMVKGVVEGRGAFQLDRYGNVTVAMVGEEGRGRQTLMSH